MAYRVIQWATGNVGKHAVRGIVEHPETELAGAYVYGAEKAGRHVGEICGIGTRRSGEGVRPPTAPRIRRGEPGGDLRSVAVAPPLRARAGVLLTVLVATLVGTAHAAGPSLSVTPHQTRTRASGVVSVVPLWDTTWWVTLQAARAAAPLTRIEYAARFADGEPRAITGGWEVGDAEHDGLSGRVLITCPTRRDYDRQLRVRLRMQDVAGAVSEWIEVEFPVRGEAAGEPAPTSPSVTVAGVARRYESLGPVEVEASSDMTIEAVKAALQRQAVEKGADAAVGLRLIKSEDSHTTFAAEAIRYIDVAPAPIPAPQATPSDRLLGEIVMPAARR